MIGNLLPHLVNGISLGLLFALIALGFMLIVGVMETINLAHGSLFALGVYVALFIAAPRLGWFPELQAAYLGLPIGTRYAIALFIAPLIVGLFGLAARAVPAPHLWARPAVWPAAHLRRGAGHRRADPPDVGIDREAAAAAGGDFRRVRVRRPDLLELPGLRQPVLRSWRSSRCGCSSRRRPTAPSSRPARTTARWCARWASTCRGCAPRCLRSAWRWPRWPVS